MNTYNNRVKDLAMQFTKHPDTQIKKLYFYLFPKDEVMDIDLVHTALDTVEPIAMKPNFNKQPDWLKDRGQ